MLASLELKLYLWTKSLWWFCRSHRRQEKSRSNCISLLIILRSALSPFACWHKWKLDSNHASTASGGLGTGIWSALGVKLWDPTFNLTWSVLLWAFVKPFLQEAFYTFVWILGWKMVHVRTVSVRATCWKSLHSPDLSQRNQKHIKIVQNCYYLIFLILPSVLLWPKP